MRFAYRFAAAHKPLESPDTHAQTTNTQNLQAHGGCVVGRWQARRVLGPDLPGFGVRVYGSGRKTYAVQTRGPNGSKRVTVGRHGAITADQARKRATAIIGRIKAGEEPVAKSPEPVPEPTVADLARRYLRTHVDAQCKASSGRRYRQALVHILPVLGEMPIGSVEREQVASLHYGLRDTPSTANAVLWVLSKMFSLAEAWGLRARGAIRADRCAGTRRIAGNGF